MKPILNESAPVSLEALAARIRASSNFRFCWQWFSCDPPCEASPAAARRILDQIASEADCHEFLKSEGASVDSNEKFKIEPLHGHSTVVRADGDFEKILARAAADHLGAYSRDLSDASVDQVQEVRNLFSSVGPYSCFELTPGEVTGCETCGVYHPLLAFFTNWFYGVAWDWCFCIIWPTRSLVWVGCLTDTD
jgi:hypothetical protein